MALSEKIYYYRKKMGISQETLAEKLGVSRQAVSKWETGESEPEILKLKQLAEIFGVTTDCLLSDNEIGDYVAEQGKTQNNQNSGNSNWVDSLPEAFGKLIRSYGWIGGVCVTAVGSIITLISAIFLVIVGKQYNKFNSMLDVVMIPSTRPDNPYLPMLILVGVILIIGIASVVVGILLIKHLKKKN